MVTFIMLRHYRCFYVGQLQNMFNRGKEIIKCAVTQYCFVLFCIHSVQPKAQADLIGFWYIVIWENIKATKGYLTYMCNLFLYWLLLKL